VGIVHQTAALVDIFCVRFNCLFVGRCVVAFGLQGQEAECKTDK